MIKLPAFTTMPRPGWIALASLSAMVLFLHACAGLKDGGAGASAKAEASFHAVVKPLFEHRCVWCHNDKVPNAGLNLQNRDRVFNSGLKFVVPGEPGQSLLYTAIGRHPQHLKAMPVDGWKITGEQAQAIRDWIAGGAPWPDGSDGMIQKKNYRVDLDDYL